MEDAAADSLAGLPTVIQVLPVYPPPDSEAWPHSFCSLNDSVLQQFSPGCLHAAEKIVSRSGFTVLSVCTLVAHLEKFPAVNLT